MLKAKENTPEYRDLISKEALGKTAVLNAQLLTLQKITIMQAQAKSDLAAMMANGFGANIDMQDIEGGPRALREAEEVFAKRNRDFQFNADQQQKIADIANKRLFLETQYANLLPIERDLLLEKFDLETIYNITC